MPKLKILKGTVNSLSDSFVSAIGERRFTCFNRSNRNGNGQFLHDGFCEKYFSNYGYLGTMDYFIDNEL